MLSSKTFFCLCEFFVLIADLEINLLSLLLAVNVLLSSYLYMVLLPRSCRGSAELPISELSWLADSGRLGVLFDV